jgi:hypothetical protein
VDYSTNTNNAKLYNFAGAAVNLASPLYTSSLWSGANTTTDNTTTIFTGDYYEPDSGDGIRIGSKIGGYSSTSGPNSGLYFSGYMAELIIMPLTGANTVANSQTALGNIANYLKTRYAL